MLPKIPPQVTRLLLLTIGIVGSYATARYFLTPPSFGEYGWYRGDALGELASYDRVYAGAKSCEECHAEQSEKVAAASHKTLSCEACHGAGQAHAENPDLHKMTILTFSHCVRCHERNPSRPRWHKQINPKEHYPGEKCTECHVPHQPAEVP